MNSENVDTEPSLQIHMLSYPCALFERGGGGGGGGEGASQGTICATRTTQFVDHKLTRIHA